MTYINPDGMSQVECNRIDRWLVANGCRYDVALEPVILRGNVVEFYSMCRRGEHHRIRLNRERDGVILTRRKLRIRIPLSEVR